MMGHARVLVVAVATWVLALPIAAAAAHAQDHKVPASRNLPRSEITSTTHAALRRGAPLQIAPLVLRDRDLGPFLRLVQNDPQPAPGATPAGQPAAAVSGEVIMLLGIETPGGGIDARVRRLAAARHPPLSLYPTIRVLSWRRTSFRSTPTTVSLPSGRRLSISVVQVLPNGRYVVRTVVSPRPGQTGAPTIATIEAAPGEAFFFAGHQHEGGTLIVGLSLGVPPP